ncbi:MAG: M6 family metalloprotease domain-containing protein [Thermotogota bacterium]|nr:M6 family metalloprotease domain-containing protein [Thermotogota bacterium]
MKKNTLTLVIIFLTVFAFSVPSYPGITELSQPDGTTFMVYQIGDEFAHLVLYNGYPVMKNPDTGWWEYLSLKEKGTLSLTGNLVKKDTPPSIKFDIQEYFRKAAKPVEYEKQTVTTGILKFPVVLINFSDTATSFDLSDFEKVFNGIENSVKDYYEETSYNKLDIQFEVVGWYNAPESHNYYSSRAYKLALEAAIYGDGDLDYSQYDNNNDGDVDSLIIIHQGQGQEFSGDPTDIWSHKSSISYETNDGVNVRGYTMQPERLDWEENIYITTIGVICHELGHGLGLPDLYDTDGSSDGIGDWGLMGHGSWNWHEVPGDSPAHLTGWSKLHLEWVNPSVLDNFHGSLTFDEVELHEDIVVYNNPARKNIEYFLLENRQKTGYDSALPGHGLLIYHIDEQARQSDDKHRKVHVVEADNDNALDEYKGDRGSDGDPFPGSTYNTSFTPDSSPKSEFYDASPGPSLTYITEDQTKIYAELNSTATNIVAEISADVAWIIKKDYDWTFNKSVDKDVIKLISGEEEIIKYAIEATRDDGDTLDSTYTITGNVIVSNTGSSTVNDIEVIAELSNIETKTLYGTETIEPGKDASYSFSFVTKEKKIEYTVISTVTSENGIATNSVNVILPDEPTTEISIDELSSIEDEITNVPEGFHIEPDVTLRTWHITEPSTKLDYSVTLFNDSTSSDIHYLSNIATLTENDSKQKLAESATVTIVEKILKDEPSSYLVAGEEAELIYNFEFPVDSCEYDVSGNATILNATLFDEGKAFKIVMEIPGETFTVTLDIYVNGVKETSELEFLPFSYLIVNDGVSKNDWIVIKEYGWDENPGDFIKQKEGLYWKQINEFPVNVFEKILE